MRYPPTQNLGLAVGPDGRNYSLHFYGEDEGAAVITGPVPPPGVLRAVSEVHREPVGSAAEAAAALLAWRRTEGWPI